MVKSKFEDQDLGSIGQGHNVWQAVIWIEVLQQLFPSNSIQKFYQFEKDTIREL